MDLNVVTRPALKKALNRFFTLQEHSDLFIELEIVKDEGYLPELGNLDTACGINSFVKNYLLGCNLQPLAFLRAREPP